MKAVAGAPTGLLNAGRSWAQSNRIVARVLLRPRVRRVIARVLATRFLAAAWQTRTPGRFLVGELTARGRLRSYPIRSGGVVLVRHGRDTEALFEIFHSGEYEPPPALSSRLGTPARVLDVGANVGMFSAWASARWPGVAIAAYEPEPENLAQLRRWLQLAHEDALATGGRPPQVSVHPAAVGTRVGTVRFATGGGAGAHLATRDDEPSAQVPSVDFFAELAVVGADLVKIDIEGAEWALLRDARLAQLRRLVLVLEYHRVGAPSLPAYDAARGLLEAAGFEVGYAVPNAWGHGILWAWKG